MLVQSMITCSSDRVELLFIVAIDNVDFIMRFQTKAVERNGKEFMQIDKSKSSFETTR